MPVTDAHDSLRSALFALGDTAVRSPAMIEVLRRVDELREGREPVLVVAESGTGKELLARALHLASPRRRGPFVSLRCAALPESLVESELFGHLRGAFRGAARDRPGCLETAAGGTLFVDEVGELPPPVQAGLLKVLRQGSFQRLGEARRRPLDVRLVAASSGGLGPAVAAGRFLRDLHGELARTVLRLPPLRRRVEDVEPLVRLFLTRASARDGVAWELAPEVLGLLLRYRWPGNARELENVLEHACAVAAPPVLRAEDLPAALLYDVTRPDPDAAVLMDGDGPADAAALKSALEAHDWCRRRAADALGIDRAVFWRRLQELGWSR